MKPRNRKKQKRLNAAAGLLLINYPYKLKSHSNAELYNADFHPNTQKIGLRFTERLRNAFRLQWLRPR